MSGAVGAHLQGLLPCLHRCGGSLSSQVVGRPGLRAWPSSLGGGPVRCARGVGVGSTLHRSGAEPALGVGFGRLLRRCSCRVAWVARLSSCECAALGVCTSVWPPARGIASEEGPAHLRLAEWPLQTDTALTRSGTYWTPLPLDQKKEASRACCQQHAFSVGVFVCNGVCAGVCAYSH